jgi:hypothetical protein
MLKRHLGLSQDVYRPVLEGLNGRIASTTAEILQTTDPLVLALKLPFFSAWIVSKINDTSRILEVAHDLAMSPPLTQARTALANLDSLNPTSREFVREANRLIRDLDATASRLRSEFGVSTRQGVALSPVIKVANIALAASGKIPVQIPDLGLKVPMPTWFGRRLDSHRLQAVFRSVVEDLGTIGRLGHLRSRLTAAADIRPNASFPKPSIEDTVWFRRNSSIRRWQ